LSELKKEFAAKKPGMATRNSSNKVLDVLTEKLPQLIGGSADLTGSVGTKTKNYKPISAKDFSGNYIHYGVREHGMQAFMNGMALHGEFIPYAGTFLVFSDYARPAIRLSALMGVRTIFVGTHDSIGLGEDGPTHQPVEHLASLRAIPNLMTFRPCDEIEVAEAWEIAIAAETTPSVISLTRQNVPTLRSDFSENKSARGGYIISEKPDAKATIIATGSEVSLAIEAQNKLAEAGINTNVVSMPCTKLFDEQPKAYRSAVLGKGLKVAVEAASGYGWERYIGMDGIFIGMNSFGASGPYQELYKHFGITADNIVKSIQQGLK
jgi:transketolase